MMLQRNEGFTLIEIMIVVAIIGILAGIAYPSYQQHIQKTRRVDAKEALTSIAAKQERWFFQYNQYSVDPNVLDVPESSGSFYSRDEHYQITITDDPCDDENCYTATATAVGAQLRDTDCRVFTIQQTGQKRSYDDSGAETTASAKCW